MIKKTIEYVDYNGTERSEDFYFNLTEAECIDLEIGTSGGYTEMIRRMVNAKDRLLRRQMDKENNSERESIYASANYTRF